MKILYVGAFRFPKYDAASARVLNNARCLKASGHSVEFISWGGCYENQHLSFGDEDLFDNFPFIITGELDIQGSVWKKILNRLNCGSKTMKILDSKKESVDLIISYNPNLVFNLKLKRFAKCNGIKYANDITEWSDKHELRLIERLTNAINLRIITKSVINKIVISSYLDKYYNQGNNIVVPPLVDLSEKKWNHFEAPIDKSRDDCAITFIYSGNPARKDNLHLIINSVQKELGKDAKIKLLILGISKEKYLSEFSGLLSTKELDDGIVFVGRIPQDEVPLYYQQSDFMILLREPNRKSTAGFPTKFVESFASGVPVVANITSDIGRYLIDGSTGFVVKDNSEEALCAVIEHICSIPKSDFQSIKEKVVLTSKQLDYHSFIAPFEQFLSHLQ